MFVIANIAGTMVEPDSHQPGRIKGASDQALCMDRGKTVRRCGHWIETARTWWILRSWGPIAVSKHEE